MISHISIKDFAIIQNVELDFYEGLNVITGETGAGKSIVIQAISLALGSRADTAFVRSGAKKAVIQLVGTHNEQEYVITREVSSSGKNLCKMNGEIVTLAHLNTICKKLADIHGQYDHQSLLNPDYHIQLVDLYQKDTISPIKEKVSNIYLQYKDISAKLANIISDAAENQKQKEFMKFQLLDITNANLIVGEDDLLAEKISVLQNSEKIYANLANAYELSSGDTYPTLVGMKKSLDLVEEVSNYSKNFSDIHQQLSEIYYTYEDLVSQIRQARDEISFSPEELNQSIDRMEVIDSLKRKHGGSLETIIAYSQELEQKLNAVENIDQIKEDLIKLKENCEKDLKSASMELTGLRKESALKLEKKVLEELTQLNFQHAQLSIKIDQQKEYSQRGMDTVEFMISANKGENLKPLSKIASGGEMSRIMLAFKKIIGDYDEIPTMIFDEIDSGISGITASIVGKKLLQIAQNHQIICITHLPQIAAFGQHNYKIEKEIHDEMTFTTVTEINEDEKVEEIGRLLGGLNITSTTLQSAKELINLSK
ncbi:MAG: DNA repair protein RecN [Anaerovoracaceae bacterium]